MRAYYCVNALDFNLLYALSVILFAKGQTKFRFMNLMVGNDWGFDYVMS